METKFTDGPWEITSVDGWDGVKPKSFDLPVCKLVENNAANANLIAAAPAMYAALEAMVETIEGLSLPCPTLAAQIALMKARGET